MVYKFDETYEGLLTAVFTAFERKEFDVELQPTNRQEDIFTHYQHILSDTEKAKRVLAGLRKKLDQQQVYDFYQGFLSEDPKAWHSIFRLLVHIFRYDSSYLKNYADDHVIYFSQTIHKVSRERHRMKAFVRFKKDAHGMFVATVEPDFNVLPLIIHFFKNRYSDQPWLIYDIKRKYGIFYNGEQVSEVNLSESESNALTTSNDKVDLDPTNDSYQKMWKSYFQSTNIEARRNMKLHLRHVPKRYWKYLPEKS